MAVLLTACKKTKNGPATTMSVDVCGDSSWTVNSVTTEYSGGFVYLRCDRASTHESVELDIKNYAAGTHSYLIENTGTTANPNQSSATYLSSNRGILAVYGSISVTEYNSTTISGTFSFHDVSSGTVSGTFTAATP